MSSQNLRCPFNSFSNDISHFLRTPSSYHGWISLIILLVRDFSFKYAMRYMLKSVYLYLSSGVDVYTAIGGATGAINGPLHGGAVEAVPKMLSEIGSVENIPEFIECVKNK